MQNTNECIMLLRGICFLSLGFAKDNKAQTRNTRIIKELKGNH